MTQFKYRRVPIVYGKSRESTTEISLEASTIKGRQSNVDNLHYARISLFLLLRQSELFCTYMVSSVRCRNNIGLIQHTACNYDTHIFFWFNKKKNPETEAPMIFTGAEMTNLWLHSSYSILSSNGYPLIFTQNTILLDTYIHLYHQNTNH